MEIVAFCLYARIEDDVALGKLFNYLWGNAPHLGSQSLNFSAIIPASKSCINHCENFDFQGNFVLWKMCGNRLEWHQECLPFETSFMIRGKRN
jgi:hypothetical protein